jgi:hypothetical protein
MSSWLASHEPIERVPLSRRSALALALVFYVGVFGPSIYGAIAYGFGGGHAHQTTQSTAYVAVSVMCEALVALVAGLAIIRGLAGTWRPVTGGGRTTWRSEVVAGSLCVCLMTISGILMIFLPGPGFPDATTTAGHVGNAIGFLRTGPVEEICALVAPLVILRAGRVPWSGVFGLLIVMRLLYHLYYGPAAIGLSLWAFGAALVYLWARSIIGIMVAHSLYDLTTFPDELGHPGWAALLHWLFVLFCLVVSVRALRRARRRRPDVQGVQAAEGSHRMHCTYFPDEQHARTAAEVIEAAGWDLQTVRRVAGGGPEWIVVAGHHDVDTTPELVSRAFFEGVAATNGPGEYRGPGAGA